LGILSFQVSVLFCEFSVCYPEPVALLFKVGLVVSELGDEKNKEDKKKILNDKNNKGDKSRILIDLIKS
jgi:hypothetical protein